MSSDKKTNIAPEVAVLIDKVLMARSRPGYAAIAAYLGLSYAWVSKFAHGQVPDPKGSIIKKLYAFFDENPSGFASDFGTLDELSSLKKPPSDSV